jgi:hypothetical protein
MIPKLSVKLKMLCKNFLHKDDGRRHKRIEFALQPLIVKQLTKNDNTELSLEQIWNALPDNIPGKYNPQNPDEYQTNEYGPIHRNKLSQKIVDAFGAVRKRKKNGIVLIFDEEKIKELKKTYQQQNQYNGKCGPKDAAPNIDIEPKKKNMALVLGEETTLAKNSKQFASLRTTIPMSIVRQWKLREGDKLDWSWEVVNNEMVLRVRKIAMVKGRK